METNGGWLMSIISNTPILQNSLAKKAFSKISFEAGEKFDARIVSSQQEKGEVNLKLLDGWQFYAKLDKPLQQGSSGSVLNFEVEGFEDGKLKIKLVYEDKENKNIGNDILEDANHEKPLSTDKTDALLFEKMIKHDMPLTKENVIDIKNLVDFKSKISLNMDKEDAFIAKYIESRNIETSSDKASEIRASLKNFFEVLKNLDVDEILLFKENNIELTKGNLESFIKLFKGDSAVYNNLKDINNYILNSDTTKNIMENIEPSFISNNKNDFIGINEKSETMNPKNIELKGEPTDNSKEINPDSKSVINTKVNGYGKNNSLNEIINMIKKELNFSEVDKGVIDNVEKEIAKTTTDILIKEQIKLKTGEIKEIVKDIIENKLNLKPETYEKVMDVFNQKLNDIKLFNSISQQYYYLDLPINVKENEYQFKLIIKDDRKKGKKIDSKNVKIATSIKTINMGTVDAYIKINNNNMNIDINCNEHCVKILDISKEKLIKDLSSLSYRVSIKVNNKTNEFTLENCGEFFNDRSFNTINIKV